MATFPSIETVLMEIHQSLELKQDQTVIPPFLKGVHSTGHDNTLVSRGGLPSTAHGTPANSHERQYLDLTEQNIIDRTLARYNSLVGADFFEPIVCDVMPSYAISLSHIANRLSAVLIRVIRSATQNPKLILHHC